jgi:DMSO/TMAO reductase YedYZ molybdopterin-dependent catalytic subunit
MRPAANVVWGGVDLAALLGALGVQKAASHIWGCGLDFGTSHGQTIENYVKDIPLTRLQEGDVMIAYELNGKPLT